MDINHQKTDMPAIADKTTSISNEIRVSSPASTGGAGTFFEQHVGAYWLAQLLVGGIPPILINCIVKEVHFQTEHLGWNTDDFLIIGKKGSGEKRKLAGQVKLTFTVSSTNKECKNTIQDFWKDFQNTRLFSPDTDRFALVAQRGTNILLKDFSGLLDCSRAVRDGDEFERRLAISGFLSAKSIKYCNEIKMIIGENEGRGISSVEIWPFLRVIHILSLDLNTETRQTEASIKNFLTMKTSEQDAIGAAEASWNALLREVSEGMPKARSYRRDDLPEILRQRYTLFGDEEQRALRALKDHSALILSGIRSVIGNNLHLKRGRLVQQVIEQMESTQVVLISGSAGSGKSVIAKDVMSILAADYFVFCFRAEEFAQPHFDTTLQNNQIPANAKKLGAILAGQARKVLLVESVERLLEKSTRDAFTDLLTLVASDKSWRLVLTCRDYSTELVRTCFLEYTGVGHSLVVVPKLDDEELEQVRASHPNLSRPLENVDLRKILCNPYVLDKALQISWSEECHLPQSEWDFRLLFWKEIVRVDHRASGGMPDRREKVFVDVALKRARELDLFADCRDLDPEVMSNLKNDSLIVSSQDNKMLVAPAHDVLEDWAILHWIEEQYVIHKGSIKKLSNVIGTHPAIRRTYRKWVTELVERDPDSAYRILHDIIHEKEIIAQFRDDTLVSLLRSPLSTAFLEKHTEDLFDNNRQLLHRVIHLLRVACVTKAPWLSMLPGPASLFNVPEGPAWACVLQLAQTHISSFVYEERNLLLGLIDDWVRGVSLQTPYPEGAKSVASIAYWLLLGFDNYQYDDQRKRTLQVIAKIPKADCERFVALLQGSRKYEERNRTAEDFEEIVFEGLEGIPAARDIPDDVVSAAKDYLLYKEVDLCNKYGYRSDTELEILFGIKHERSHKFFPVSAYRGPFLPLLRYHPQKGLDLIIDVFNHSADWYAHPRVQSKYVEPPSEITLTFADGTYQTQWCNTRLWNLYRGTTVGPYVLQSILMALERWLLEFAEWKPGELDGVLLQILKRSKSAAITAVVASAATAFPHESGKTLLVMLRSPVCIKLDRIRLVSESQSSSQLSEIMPLPNTKVYEDERRQSNGLPHRHYNLETAIGNLQLGPLAHRVHEILDQNCAEMPPLEEQSEDDRIWRLAMHRMDLRQYIIPKDPQKVYVNIKDGISTEDVKQYIRLDIKEPEPDIKEMLEESEPQLQETNRKINLLMWGIKIFNREHDTTFNPAHWRERLQESQNTIEKEGTLIEHQPGRGGKGFVASVCVRDHWKEMSNEEQFWCVDILCSEVERDSDNWNQLARVQKSNMCSDRTCALALPLLFGKSLPQNQQIRLKQTLVIALTHAINEVRWYAAWGIGENLWMIDRELVLRCVNAIATEAMLVQQVFEEQKSLPYNEHREIDDIEKKVAYLIRQRFFEADYIEDDAYQSMDPTTWFGANANGKILSILEKGPDEFISISAFERLAHTLVLWWDKDDECRQNHESPKRNFNAELTLSYLLDNFLLRTANADAIRIIKPIVDAIDRHPDKVHFRLIGLIRVEDLQPNTSQFWSIWEQFAEGVRRAKWLARIDDEYAKGREMISAIFLGTGWKEGIRHWQSLEGYTDRVNTLFENLPASSTVLDNYLRFLYHIGEQSLPEAFIRISKRLHEGDPSKMMKKRNTLFILEVLLQRYVYGKPLELKRQANLRDAILFLLDLLVENGSSAAYRMRDDFVTPVSST